MRLKQYLKESARSPKKGDRFEYKGKKLTILDVGSGMGYDKYIQVQFDKEKHPRSISMKNFFKGNDFKYIKEGFQTRSLMDHIPLEFLSKKQLVMGIRQKINKDIQKLLKPTYFRQIPIGKLFKILEKHGVVPIAEDNTYWSGILAGGVKKTEQVYFNLGWKEMQKKDMPIDVDPNLIKYPNPKGQYLAIPNAVLNMSYFKMPSGNYEVIAYIG